MALTNITTNALSSYWHYNESSWNINFIIFSNKQIWTVAFSLQFVLGVVGNFFIIWSVHTDNRLKNTTNYIMASIAVSDILVSFSQSLYRAISINDDFVWLIAGDFGNFLCKLRLYANSALLGVSTFCCVAMGIDRYYAVVHPMRRIFQSKIKFIIPGIWVICGLLNSPSLYFSRIFVYYGKILYCNLPPRFTNSAFSIYDYIIMTVDVAIPAIIIKITYIVIVIKLYQHKTPGVTTDLTRQRRERQNKKVLQMSVVYVVCLYFSIVCGFFAQLPLNTDFVLACTFIGNMNVVYNFFISVIFNDIYREKIKVLIKRCCCFCRFNRIVGNTREASRPRPAVTHEMSVMNAHNNIENNRQ